MLQKAKIRNSNNIGAEDNFDWQAAWELYNSIYNAEDFDFGPRGVNMSAGSGGIYSFSGYGGGGRGRVANLPSLRNPGGVAWDGEPWRIHTVQKGETLWSISQKYAVSLYDIYRANPDIKWD